MILKILLWIALVSFVSLPFFKVFALSIPVDALVGKLGKEEIFKSDVDRYFQTLDLREKIDALFARSDLAGRGKKASFEEVIDFLTNQSMILQSFPVPDSEVEDTIKGIEKSNRATRSALIREFESQGFQFKDYFELIRFLKARALLLQQAVNLPVFTDDDLKQEFYQMQTASNKPSSAFHLILFSFPDLETASQFELHVRRGLSVSKWNQGVEETDLGFLSEEELSHPLPLIVKKMKEGEFSKVLSISESDDSQKKKKKYWIVQLKGVRAEVERAFLEKKEELRMQLMEKETERQIRLWLERKKAAWLLPKQIQETQKNERAGG